MIRSLSASYKRDRQGASNNRLISFYWITVFRPLIFGGYRIYRDRFGN